MHRRLVIAVVVGASLTVAGAVLYEHVREERGEELVDEAREELHAPLVRAPELTGLSAGAALSRLEEAREIGIEGRTIDHLEAFARAVVELQEGDLLGATRAIEHAEQDLGSFPELHLVAGAVARRGLDYEVAREHAAAILERSPEHPRALLLAGDSALDAGEVDDALGFFETLARVEPRVAVVHNRLGLARERNGDLEGAERAYRRAIRFDRRNHGAFINLGRVVGSRGEIRASLEAFESALALAPTDPDALLGRGLALAALGELDRAAADLERAAELAEGDQEPVLALGDIARSRGEISVAISLYREALDRNPRDPVAYSKLGNLLIARSELDEALTAFDRAIAIAPDLAAAHNGRGAALMHLGRHAEAEEAFERAAALDRRDPNPLLNLGLLNERIGDARAARRAFERALARDPSSEVARQRLGRG